ncbi:MAG: ATP-binding protein [Bryobacteraceae bacterium]
MRSFFIQIFLSFWASTVAIFFAAHLFLPRHDFGYPENRQPAFAIAVRDLAQVKQGLGKQQACGAYGFEQHLVVLNKQNLEVCGQFVSSEARDLAAQARSTRHQQSTRVDTSWVLAVPLQEGGVALLQTPFHQPAAFPPMPQAALPVSAIVTFVFAYFLTKPVRALREAFRNFTAGDLSVRLPVSPSVLRGWGGADIRTLMIDFNTMADRIQGLLGAHKVLLRDVSHELRSPLARLNVALELAREESPQPLQALDRAELESSRLNALIGELLSLSHMESLSDLSMPRPINLGDLVESLMPDLQFEAESAHCTVIHERKSESLVSGNPEVLRRALENVIRNSIRYSPRGGLVQITTETRATGTEQQAVVLISDQGPGVPETELARIFRPFYRVDSSRQLSTGGFGVGLAIADRAVALHHGNIRAHNRPDGGLCVDIILPCSATVAKQHELVRL